MAQRIGMVCIGEELLDGRTQEKNGAFLMEWAGERAASVRGLWIVGDELAPIIEALNAACRQCDIVVVSGGLGPTADDITRDAAAEWVGEALVTDEVLVERLEALFAGFGRPFTENNRRQCAFPERARVLATEVGTAAGFALKRSDCEAFFFPGVPAEFRWFVNRHLDGVIKPADDALRHWTRLQFFGLGESQLEDKLDGIEELAAARGSRVGYRAAFPIVEIILKGSSPENLAPLVEGVEEKVGPWLVGKDDEQLCARLGRRLVEAGATVSVAESCTAGGLGAALTEVSGSSAWFERGYITYANEAKIEELGVPPEILEVHGAVSPETVTQMALGARERARSTFALAISGIAGPTGGSPEKPVGCVHLALATPQGVYHQELGLGRFNRSRIRQASVFAALALLLWHLEGKLASHGVLGPLSEQDVRQGHIPKRSKG